MAESRDVAALSAAVLEAEIRRTDASVVPEVLLADAELPGVDDDAMSLREALRLGGARTITILGLLGALQLMDGGVFNVLAPDIQKSLRVSDAVLGAIGGATGVLFVLGAIPMSSLSDRTSRKRLIAITMSVWAVVIALTGAVQNAFQMFLARFGAGLGQSAQLPVERAAARRHLSDHGAVRVCSRCSAAPRPWARCARRSSPVGSPRSPAATSGWRLGVRPARVGRAARSRCRPTRSRNRGGAGTRCGRCSARSCRRRTNELPISLSVAFERLRKIQSFYYFLVGMAALGFALFTAPLFLNLYFDDELGLDAFQRGVIATIIAIPTLLAIAVSGRRADALFRRSPPAAMAFVGLLVALFGIGLVGAIWLPSIWAVVPVLALATACAQAAFTILPAVVSTIIPYRLRARGTAMIGIYVFLFGSFFGAVLTGLLSDAYGTRAALAIIVLPATLIGGALIALGARHIRHDMTMVVEELREEQEERTRMQQSDAVVPVLQVRNLDFSYGKVQVLFDVELRRPPGRDAGAARHQRRREVDAAARHQRPRRGRPRRGPAARSYGHLRGS